MRNYDTLTATTTDKDILSSLIRKIQILEEESQWPRQSMEEWRRTEIEKPDALEEGTAVISLHAAEEDSEKISLHPVHPGSACLRMLENDLGDNFTAMEFGHRLQVLQDPGDTAVEIRVKKGAVLAQPVSVTYIYGTRERKYHTHTFITLEESSQACIIESHRGPGGAVFVTSGAHIKAGPNSRLQRVLVQDIEKKGTFTYNSYEKLERDASYNGFEGQFGGKTVKSRITVDAAGEGVSADLHGIYVSGEGQHKDVKPVQRHSSPQSSSRSFYKGSVHQDGKSVFQGIIQVAEGAEETDAYLTNKNLILNDGARADSIPNLEILNNNVKCSHGSTTGRLNDDEVFYLESRGIEKHEAHKILIEAYFEHIIAELPEEAEEQVRESIEHFIENWKS